MPGGSVVDFPWTPTNVTASTLVRTGNSVLHTIVVNELTADAVTVTLYDGVDAGGSVVGVITTELSQPVTLLYDSKFKDGIYIAIAGEGTADLTVNHT